MLHPPEITYKSEENSSRGLWEVHVQIPITPIFTQGHSETTVFALRRRNWKSQWRRAACEESRQGMGRGEFPDMLAEKHWRMYLSIAVETGVTWRVYCLRSRWKSMWNEFLRFKRIVLLDVKLVILQTLFCHNGTMSVLAEWLVKIKSCVNLEGMEELDALRSRT